MSAEQSQFSRLPKKQLVRIAEKLVDEGFDTDNPYSDYEENYNILENIAKVFSMSVNDEDVQFFAKFLYINDGILAKIMEKSDILSYEDLIIPVAKTYELQYTVWGSCSYEEYLGQKFDAYDKDWVRDSADQQRNDGNWDTYEGYNRRDTHYEDYQESDFSYDKVVEVNDSTNVTEPIKEQKFNKTSKVISTLDKESLLELKKIIDSRLRLL